MRLRRSLRRLDVESIRDSILQASGRLNLNPPGKSLVNEMGFGYTHNRWGFTAADDFDYTSLYRSALNVDPPRFEPFEPVDGSPQISSSVARVKTLIGFRATLPQSFTQISLRMSSRTGACSPAAMSSSASRRTPGTWLREFPNPGSPGCSASTR